MPGTLARRFANLAFGGRCFLCRGAAGAVLCAECDADLPRLVGPLCPRCALAAPAGEVCGRCLAHPPAYDATVAALGYEFPADTLVQALKFRGELALAPLLGALLAARLPRAAPVDCVLPVPLAAARLRARGFNQAMEIARHVARATGSRLEPALAERSRDTAAQVDLPHDARARNVRGAFRCARALEGAAVAVVDDVMTTGATLDELAGTLKRAGAARVVNWVVARTPAPADA
ncbi:MAG: double zinc ribbon domain-containing protein [Betaproteobacteria bacterium]|nr:double zinc ribbon domain-containing protein [Betaproteobacteria bacterium]